MSLATLRRREGGGRMSATFVIATGLVSQQEQQELLAEARDHHSRAERYGRPRWRVVDDRQFLGPARFWYAPHGQIREDVHGRLALEKAPRSYGMTEFRAHPLRMRRWRCRTDGSGSRRSSGASVLSTRWSIVAPVSLCSAWFAPSVRTEGTMVPMGVTKVSVSLDDEAMAAARSAADAEGIPRLRPKRSEGSSWWLPFGRRRCQPSSVRRL
jgi:hypothetical protein